VTCFQQATYKTGCGKLRRTRTVRILKQATRLEPRIAISDWVFFLSEEEKQLGVIRQEWKQRNWVFWNFK